jgi:hypothetical protein
MYHDPSGDPWLPYPAIPGGWEEHMPVEMAIWKITDRGPIRLDFSPLGLEEHLESMVVEDPNLVGLDVLVIGRQVPRPYGGSIDVLCVDDEARVHVLELKRNRTPRDVVAQTIDYGSWVRDLGLEDVQGIYSQQHNGASFDEAFAERFGHPLPDVFNPEEQLTIIAGELDAASDRIVAYLAERYGVRINVVFFRHFIDADSHYLARTWLLPPEEVSVAQTRGHRAGTIRPWNGQDFYVVLGNLEQGTYRWDIARSFGLLSAGGGSWYWKPLRNLSAGKRVFAYVGGAGYVGAGVVDGEMIRARDATVSIDGREVALVDRPDLPEAFRERALSDDLEVTEFVVPVRWEREFDVNEAIAERGLFASQVTVCKLRDERTIAVLTERFGLAGAET